MTTICRTERPVLFSGPMVRALLAGTKTQTRRVVKPQPPAEVRDFCTYHNPRGDGLAHFGWDDQAKELQSWFAVCPYGQIGDRLWVREAHYCIGETREAFYRATGGWRRQDARMGEAERRNRSVSPTGKRTRSAGRAGGRSFVWREVRFAFNAPACCISPGISASRGADADE